MIYSVNLSDDFADCLTAFIVRQAHHNPFLIAKTQVILPTKRACKTVRDSFLRLSSDAPLLLPQLTPLYELDKLHADLPPKMPTLKRTLLLARMCLKKPNIISTDKAITVAIGLGELLDEFYQYEIDINNLNSLVQEKQFADHWNETVKFLDIIHTYWPQILAEYGQIDEMDYTVRMIKSYAARWTQNPPDYPVIMAGFDGAIPAVITLAKTVYNMPKGTLFLNGVNTTLSREDFEALPRIHPQYPLKRLLDGVGVLPQDIHPVSPVTPTETLMYEALKPAEQTNTWQYVSNITSAAIQHLTRIECEGASEEALTIALLLRRVLETPAQTAAFITTDRTLARRVIGEMKRWGIHLDDSAGCPLSQTPVGVFLSLLCDYAIKKDGPSLLALLKHPLSADGQDPAKLRTSIKSAEFAARKKQQPLEYQLAEDLSAFTDLFGDNKLIPFATILKHHIRAAEGLATSCDRSAVERLWGNEAGETAYAFLSELTEYAPLLGDIEPDAYPSILTLLMGHLTVRPKYGMHPRLDILGPIEARLHQPDVIIIGALNEGTFPQLPETGPWLNRPMREVLGLPPLENKIAVSAMDFANCFCGREVYLTRSLKENGSPTIPSRFLLRTEAVLTAAGIPWEIQGPDWARLMDRPRTQEPIIRPAPTPPIEARPKKLSVTKIETWMRDPYAVYARYVLKLYPLEELESHKKNVLFGTAVHKALEIFVRDYPKNESKNTLYALGQNVLTEAGFDAADLAFYVPKFHTIADWFIARQQENAPQIRHSYVERQGEITLTLADGQTFTLTGNADRIDILQDGTAQILDYKTGTLPKVTEIKKGYAPQLPLEGYILLNKGFADLEVHEVSNMLYWKLSAKPAGSTITSLTSGKEKITASEMIDSAANRLKQLVNIFNNESIPYEACPVFDYKPQYNDYEYLERAKEWQTAEDKEESDD
ncbi:MAG: PD-(D/E)XK nuclease family protein [Alphaproteobacteria bacterium]